jgi:hypothetical protein
MVTSSQVVRLIGCWLASAGHKLIWLLQCFTEKGNCIQVHCWLDAAKRSGCILLPLLVTLLPVTQLQKFKSAIVATAVPWLLAQSGRTVQIHISHDPNTGVQISHHYNCSVWTDCTVRTHGLTPHFTWTKYRSPNWLSLQLQCLISYHCNCSALTACTVRAHGLNSHFPWPKYRSLHQLSLQLQCLDRLHGLNARSKCTFPMTQIQKSKSAIIATAVPW